MLRYLAFRKVGIALFEHLLLVFCVLDAHFILFGKKLFTEQGFGQAILRGILIALVYQSFLHLRDAYDFRKVRSISADMRRVAEAVLLASAFLGGLHFVFPGILVSRSALALMLLIAAAFLIFWQLMLRFHLTRRTPGSNIVVLGTGKLACELVREILRRPELGIGVKGFLGDDPTQLGVSIVNPCVIGLYADLPQVVSEKKIDRIVVGLENRRGKMPVKDLLKFKMSPVAIEDATSLYERVTGKIAVENLKPSWMIFNSGFEMSRCKLILKQITSTFFSLALLILLAPVILLVMALIKLDSRGPIFYKQERVGQDGRIFTLWKFRSMSDGAESATGPVWADLNDPRVTRVGRLLRRLRLDEVPQLYNVLRGDMSLVGPRPERPVFVKKLTEKIPYYQLRHAVKPGVTGWAQINYEYANSLEDAQEKLQYDLFYVKNMSLLLDLVIVFETVKTVLVRRGS